MDLTVDNWRFFAGGARFLEGRAAGEYLEDHTSFVRRDPLGVVGVDRAVELPAQHGDVEARARARRRQHRGAEAVGAHAADRAAARRDHRRHPPAGRAQRRDRPGRDRGRRARARTPTSRWCRSPATSRPARPSPRAAADSLKRVHLELGGKAPVDRVRRRRHRGARRDARRDRLLQLRPGLHRAVPRASPGPACSTTSSPGSPTRSAQITTGDPFDDDTAMGPVDLGRPARARRGHGRPRRRRRRRGHRRRRARSTAPASSTSRRSS